MRGKMDSWESSMLWVSGLHNPSSSSQVARTLVLQARTKWISDRADCGGGRHLFDGGPIHMQVSCCAMLPDVLHRVFVSSRRQGYRARITEWEL
ncbi:hypothetical protein HII31_12342 [Pseudocercospora fuligena]|uniref:Uncharacterized protein n=1 Tax=Pseudocercospora fuligena TaxID=685502 RepID=A0A8H6VD70_9PEZI|nr:hypothetical protein HII31_12342 [Pseudocercospora fuligena]